MDRHKRRSKAVILVCFSTMLKFSDKLACMSRTPRGRQPGPHTPTVENEGRLGGNDFCAAPQKSAKLIDRR